MTRTEALRKVYKKVTNEEAPVTANTITEVLVALADKYSGDEPVTANTITDALVALADNYSGGGGGGSSDFSTAEVTIVGGIVNGCFPYLINDYGLEGLFVVNQGYVEGSHTIALWHGTCIVELEGDLSISGSIEDMGERMYLITGDCTITIS